MAENEQLAASMAHLSATNHQLVLARDQLQHDRETQAQQLSEHIRLLETENTLLREQVERANADLAQRVRPKGFNVRFASSILFSVGRVSKAAC